MKKTAIYFIFICLIFNCFYSFSQPIWKRFDSVSVYKNSTNLKNPWAGGLNFINWSELDLDLDGSNELVAFDKSGEKIRCFKFDQTPGFPNYTHFPNWQDSFPPVSSFVLFYDYNSDGKSDLFTYSLGNGGIKVYRNNSTPGNMSFTLEKNYLTSNYNPSGTPQYLNIIASTVALPGLADFDKDGDMDVLVFGSGIKLDYHKNLSKEVYGHSDSLLFVYADDCWGDIQETTCQSQLNVCPYPIQPEFDFQIERNNSHQTFHGGSCLMCFDSDGDGDKDVLLGDISCDSIEFFRNGGIFTNAHIDSTTKKFPSAQPVKLAHFPCTYFIDVNRDGKRDLLASPNISGSENYKSNWFYRNSFFDSIPKFIFVKDDFLQDQMIDFGEGAYPAIFDYEGDGDLDLLIGNFGYFIPPSGYSPQLALLLNTGNNANPSFTISDLDFLANETIGLNNLAPAFADMDADGDDDLICGTFDGKLVYFQNTSSVGSPATFSFVSDFSTGFLSGIDVGQEAYPTVYDINKDGKKDLVVGEYDGTLSYYQNIGTANAPAFATAVTNFGNLRTNQAGYFVGRSMPVFFDDNGFTKLLIGSERGFLYLYGNIDGNLNGSFSKIDSTYTNIIEGEHTAPALADFNNDGILDMILGNYSGGLAFLKGNMNTSNLSNSISVLNDVNLFPNPTRGIFNCVFNSYNLEKKSTSITDLFGRTILELPPTNSNEIQIDLSNQPPGIYFLIFKIEGSKNGKVVKKIHVY